MDYRDYVSRFHRDLPFLDPRVDGDDPYILCKDPARALDLARYYMAHPEFEHWGREPLLECVLMCFDDAMRCGVDMPEMHTLMRIVVARAIKDIYDRDQVAIYYKLTSPGDPYPLSDWLDTNFPVYVPARSIWLELGDRQAQQPGEHGKSPE